MGADILGPAIDSTDFKNSGTGSSLLSQRLNGCTRDKQPEAVRGSLAADSGQVSKTAQMNGRADDKQPKTSAVRLLVTATAAEIK